LGAEGSRFADQIKHFLQAAEVQVVDSVVGQRGHLIFDASGIASAEQSAELYEFFHQNIKFLKPCGRVIVIGLKASACRYHRSRHCAARSAGVC